MKGIASFNILGIFKKFNFKKNIKLILFSTNLEISIEFINKIKVVTNNPLYKIYFKVLLNK